MWKEGLATLRPLARMATGNNVLVYIQLPNEEAKEKRDDKNTFSFKINQLWYFMRKCNKQNMHRMQACRST